MTPTDVARLARLEAPFPASPPRPTAPAPVLDGFVLLEGVLLPASARLAGAMWSKLWSMSRLEIGSGLTIARVHCYQRDKANADDLDPLAEAGIRLLATPQQLGRYPDAHPPWAYMLDNGAFGEGGFQPDRFRNALGLLGRDADAVVLPDIVCGGRASLRLSLDWMHRVLQVGALRALIPVQDGMVPADVRRYLADVRGRVGLFVGGSTAWKESTMRMWGDLAEEMACWMHVGRVNTQRRMALAVAAGAHSVDGSSATRFACRAAPLVASARQGDMFRSAT